MGLDRTVGSFAKPQNGALCELGIVTSDDGVPLKVFTAGDARNPATLLINAYGIPAGIWEPVARALANEFYLVTWESRSIPNLSHAFDRDRCGVGDHAGDLRAVFDALDLGRAHLVGWCSGAQVALRFASESSARVASVILLSGSFRSLAGVPASEFQETLASLVGRCAKDRRRCEIYWRALFGGGLGGKAPGLAEVPATSPFSSAWAHVPEEVRGMTQVPFQSPEALYRYANTLLAVEAEPAHAWADDVEAPVLLLAGGRDAIVHPQTWEELARRLRHARLQVDPVGDHYMLYLDDSVPNSIRSFLSDPSRV